MTKRTTWAVIGVVLLCVAAGAALAGPKTPQSGVLTSTLEVERYRHEASDELAVTFSLTNNGAESAFVLRWQTPLDGIEADILVVERDGKPVPYIGKLIKRPAPIPEDYVEIKAGETLSVTFDPSATYDMRAKGEYTIRYRAVLQPPSTTAATDLLLVPGTPTQRVIESNDVRLWIEGIEPGSDTFDETTLENAKKPPAPSDPAYNGCSNTQISTLNTAKSNALSISSKAVNHLAANPNGSTLYTYWFGTYTSSRFNTVDSHFDAIADAFANKTVTFDCTCRQRYYAYVYPTQPYKIYLCKVFWSAPNLGRDSKAGTLVHEMSHFNVVAGTDDYVYGATAAHNLAMTDPAKAVDNADNHEYFAEDQ